jgi:hypothetical protein
VSTTDRSLPTQLALQMRQSHPPLGTYEEVRSIESPLMQGGCPNNFAQKFVHKQVGFSSTEPKGLFLNLVPGSQTDASCDVSLQELQSLRAKFRMQFKP